MAVNRTKVLEAAQKFQTKGQYDKAIAEYQKLVVEDPRDVRTLLKIGDLHTRRNKPKDAIDVYDKVAELYAKQGFFLKAVAVYKQILKLDAGHLSSTLKLAKMYEELALASDALATYEQAADAYVAQGNMPKALETMHRMIELDPQNIAARIKYAEALSKADKPADAAKAFAEGARLLREQGRIDDYLRVVERQLYHDPDNVEIARELATRYLERNDPKRALAKLQVCFKADPRDVQTLEMLAEAFRQLGQIPKTVSVLKEIARLHGEINDDEPRRRTLLRVLDLDPTDAEAKQALAAIPAPKPQPASARPGAAARAPEPESAEEMLLEEEEEELSLLDAEEEEPASTDGLLVVAEDSIADQLPEASPSYPSITGLLTAAEGYESNGNYEQAEEALKTVLLLDEGNVGAHERLKDLYLATDRRVDAVRELLWLSEAWDARDLEQARGFAHAAFQLAPRAEATRQRLEALGLDPETGEPASSTEEVVFVDDASDELPAFDSAPHEVESAPAFAPSAGTEPERPSVRGESAPPLAGSNPLDIPIDPDEFTAGARRPRVAPLRPSRVAEMASLLDEPISPDEFEPDQRVTHAPEQPDMAALLDAPISPDEFDAPPGRGRISEAPLDDFGLADDRFDRSDLHEVMEEPLPPRAAASEQFEELGSSDVDLEGTGALPAYRRGQPSAPPVDPFEADLTGFETAEESDFDLPPAEHTQREPLPEAELLAEAEARADQQPDFEDALADFEQPEPTVPAEPIPELIRRSSHDNLEPVRPELLEPVPAAEPSQPRASLAQPSQPSETLTPEIEEALDEASFFASQALLDEALEVVQEAILIYPGSKTLQERLAEYEAALVDRDAAAARKDDTNLDASFDIAEQLASELVEVAPASPHDDMVDVESVFAQFKRGVAQQIGEEDTDTHFDLGIAYKEMGLIDDAISEFEVSAKSPKRACTALTMVGMCQLEKGDAAKAVSYFERALGQSVRTPAEELALYFEIGNAYEHSGQLDKAIAAFEKAAAKDRTFRGVGARLEQLKQRGLGAHASRASR